MNTCPNCLSDTSLPGYCLECKRAVYGPKESLAAELEKLAAQIRRGEVSDLSYNLDVGLQDIDHWDGRRTSRDTGFRTLSFTYRLNDVV